MDKPRTIPPPVMAKPQGAVRSDAAVAQFWFEPVHGQPGHLTVREKYTGVALAGALLALATFGYYGAGGNLQAAIPVISLILFLTVLGVGFFLLRREPAAKVAEPDVIAGILARMGTPAAVSDHEGHLVSANEAYRDYFSGRTPSPRRLLFEKGYAKAVRLLLREANQGRAAELKIATPEKKGEDAAGVVAVHPQGGYILWTFTDARTGVPPGNLEAPFHLLLDRFSTGLVVRDKDSIIRYANPLALKLLGAPGGDVRGAPADKVLSAAIMGQKKLSIEWLNVKDAKGEEASYKFGLVKRLGGAGERGIAFEEFSEFVKDAPIAIAVVDTASTRIEHLNAVCEEMFRKYTAEPLKTGDKLLDRLPKKYVEAVKQRIAAGMSGDDARPPFEFSFHDQAGDVIQVYFGGFEGRGKKLAILYLIDTSEVKRLEQQFVQAQKMQAVGQLAGGVAHDFNNLLTAIIGFCDLLLMRHKPGDQSFADLIQIKQNANRAADLIRQLLAFSRRQALHPKVLNVSEVLSDLSNLIRRLIGEKTKLRMSHGKDVGYVRADQSQIEQVIVNLAVNARDAMPKGGTLTITTEGVDASVVQRLGYSGLEKRDYVRITVSDTGQGIRKDHLDKVFEPFFTTKAVGKGTGLGLSTAYGIITQTGGSLFVASKEGEGAAFDIFLPALSEEVVKKTLRRESETETMPKDLTGSEVILFVEDEDPVRTFVSRALQSKGYKVLEADSGEAALEVLKTYKGPLDMLISDVVMPNMDGPSLARKIMEKHPKIKIILISGYAGEGYHKGLDRARFSFVGKPFTLHTLAARVRLVLEEDKKGKPASAARNKPRTNA